MYVRDSNKMLFKIQKFDHNKITLDTEYRKRAKSGIKYDQLLHERPDYEELYPDMPQYKEECTDIEINQCSKPS